MWDGTTPSAANWKGNNSLPGAEELYLVPTTSNTTDTNYIGIVDGNQVALPTSYPVLNVATLNSTNINNAENINTDTINNNPIPVDASQWSLYPAINSVAMATYEINDATNVNVNSTVSVGTSTDGGTVNIGTTNFNPSSAPSLTIGNSTLAKSSVNIYGKGNLTGFGALSVTGGVTLDAGSITDNEGLNIHGINMYAAGVEGVSTVRATLGELGISLYTAQPEVQGISLNALASAVTINTGTELTSRSVLGTEIEAGTGVYVSGLTAGSYNDGRMFIQHICPAYTEATNLLIDGANDLTSGRTGVELRDGVVVDTAVLNVTNINDKDSSAGLNIVCGRGDLHLEANDTSDAPHNITILSTTADVNIQAGGNIVLDTQTSGGADININSNRDLSIVGYRTLDIYASGAGTLTLESDTTAGLFSYGGNTTVEASADVNVTSNAGNINLTANTDDGGSITLTASQQINLPSPVFLVDVYGTGGANIQFHNNVDLLTSVLYAGALSSPDVYATNLHTYGSGTLINVLNKFDMNSNNIINCPQVTGTGALTLASGGTNTSVVLTPNGTGLIVANKGLNMNSNDITNAVNIGGAGALTLTSGGTNTNIVLTPTGTGKILCSKSVDLNGQTLTNATLITTPSNTDLTLTPSGTGLIKAGKGLNMNSLPITNLSTLNGHNLYSYGRFYNSVTQTLSATGTATRVKMDTTATSSGITLDTTTNIGRLTFTNAGTYEVNWNGYFLHGTGGASNNFIWIRLNGTDVAGTGKKQRLDAGLNDVSIGSSAQVTVTASQYIEFFWAADDTNTPLTAVAASSPYPATPAFSCSINIVA